MLQYDTNTEEQLHSPKPELRFCAGSKPACGVLEICDGNDLLQWSRLEIRLNVFRLSAIPKKQFLASLPPFFYSDTNPVLGHVQVYSLYKTNALAVKVKLIWLLLLKRLSFNFVLTPSKYLKFTRFRRS